MPEPSSLSARIADALTSRPKTALVAILVLSTICGVFASGVQFEPGTKKYWVRDSPTIGEHDLVAEHFVNDKVIYITYETDDIFSYRALVVIRELGEEILKIKNPIPDSEDEFAVEKVTSLTTVEDVFGSEMAFRTKPLVPDVIPTDRAALDEIRQRALKNTVIRENLLNEATNAGMVRARTLNEFEDAEIVATIAAIYDIVASLEAENDWIRFHLNGFEVQEYATVTNLVGDFMRFIPGVMVVMALMVFVFVRKVRGVLVVFVAMALALVGAIGVLVAVDGTVHIIMALVPIVISSVTTAIFLHLLSELRKNADAHGEDMSPRLTLRQLLAPTAIASTTTAVGFASITVTTQLIGLAEFGYTVGGGILLAFVLSVLVFVWATAAGRVSSLVGKDSLAISDGSARLLDRFADWVIRRRYSCLAGSLLVSAVFVGGIPQIIVDPVVIEYFDEDAPVRIATRVTDSQIGGSNILVASVKHTDQGRFLDPIELKKIKGLGEYMKSDLGANHVTTAADYIELMNRGFFDEDDAYLAIPETKEQIAQLVLLNGDLTFDEYMDEGHGWVRVVGRFVEHSAQRILERNNKLKAYLMASFPESAGYQVFTGGREKLHSETAMVIIQEQIVSLTIALFLIFGLLWFYFRSTTSLLVAIPCNLIPVAASLGFLGWTGVRLDVGTVLIAASTLGIAVDDTVHFITHLRTRLFEHGDLERGIRETLAVKGPAIAWTTIVLTLGFSVLLISSFELLRSVGYIFIVGILVAGAADLIFLPSLLLILRTRLGTKTANTA